MSKVTLSPFVQDTARRLAKARYDRNRREGVKDQKVGPQSTEQTDLDGIAGEFVVCKFLNLWPDMETDHRPDWDLVYQEPHRGLELTIDVKTTRYQSGKLLAVPGKALKIPDVYCLVIGEMPTFRIAGFALGEALVNPTTLTDLGHGPTHALSQKALRTWSEILAFTYGTVYS